MFLSADAGLEGDIGDIVSLYFGFRPLFVQALCIGGDKQAGSKECSDDGLHGTVTERIRWIDNRENLLGTDVGASAKLTIR